MPANEPIAVSKKMAAYIRDRMGKDVPLYREIVMWDDDTFQVKVVHTFDAKKNKKRVCLMYTSKNKEYVAIEGMLDVRAAEPWNDIIIQTVPNRDVEK
jgi:hypothetical protein